MPLDMTPMIDIVFQLLIFFILTLQISQPEGDLELALPLTRGPGQPTVDATLPLVVVLRSNAGGSLAEVRLGDARLADIDELHQRVERLVADNPALSQSGSVDLSCDANLDYEHAIAAVTAVSGSRLADGTIRPLIQKVSFRPAE
jgi:biopolymer transport protein ExbD